jgi:hypothetical protein
MEDEYVMKRRGEPIKIVNTRQPSNSLTTDAQIEAMREKALATHDADIEVSRERMRKHRAMLERMKAKKNTKRRRKH